VTVAGRLFQRREAATANIRSPTDDNLVGGTSSALEAEDRSRRLDGMSATRRIGRTTDNWVQRHADSDMSESLVGSRFALTPVASEDQQA
jgi:hypothetical protein